MVAPRSRETVSRLQFGLLLLIATPLALQHLDRAIDAHDWLSAAFWLIVELCWLVSGVYHTLGWVRWAIASLIDKASDERRDQHSAARL